MLHLPDAVCVLVLCLTLDYSLHFTKIKDIKNSVCGILSIVFTVTGPWTL